MSEFLLITIPLIPPSVNATIRGEVQAGRLKKEHRKFIDDVCLFARGKRAPAGPLEVRMRVFLAPRRWQHVPDVDNLPKLVLDGLKAAGVFDDDRVISDLTIRRRRAQDRQDERTLIIVNSAADLEDEVY